MKKYFSKTGLDENKYLILGHLTFFALFIFSFVLMLERMLYIDSGYQVFEIIKAEYFSINDQRYSMYLFQIFPVLAAKLHLPLSVVMHAYSLSIPIIGYVLWLITVYFLKDKKSGILMLFVMLGIRHTFFHTISETFQLMFFAVFLYAWLFQTRDFRTSYLKKTIYYFIASLFIILCIFIHPVAMFFVAFVIGIYILNKDIPVSQKVMITILSAGIIIIRFLSLKQGSYNNSFMMSMSELSDKVSHLFSHKSTGWFRHHFPDFYWIPLLMLFISLFFYLKKKKYWHFAFLLGFVALFWVVTIVVYSKGGGDVGMERSFLPLFFFCGVPFIAEVFPNLSWKWDKLFFIGLIVFLVVAFVKISNASIPYTKRLQKMEEVCTMANEQGTKKILMTQKTAQQIFKKNSWNLGLESMLYSSLKGIDSTVNIYAVENIDPDEPGYQDINVYFAVPWWTYWYINNLNPHYFKLPKQLPVVLTVKDDQLVMKEFSDYFAEME